MAEIYSDYMKKFMTLCFLLCVSFYLFADEIDIYPSPEGIVAMNNFCFNYSINKIHFYQEQSG
jgi:hypothetical protein